MELIPIRFQGPGETASSSDACWQRVKRTKHGQKVLQQRLYGWMPVVNSGMALCPAYMCGVAFIVVGTYIMWDARALQSTETIVEYTNLPSGNFSITLNLQPYVGDVVFYKAYSNFDNRYRNCTGHKPDLYQYAEKFCVCNKSANPQRCKRIVKVEPFKTFCKFTMCAPLNYSCDYFQLTDAHGQTVPLTAEGIVHETILKEAQYDDEVIWRQSAAFTSFRKPFRRLDRTDPGTYSLGLPGGTYHLLIEQKESLAKFNVRKFFVISSTSWLGTRSSFLGVLYVVFGSIFLFLAIVLNLIHCRCGKTIEELSSDKTPLFHFH
ncbi:transmembrane protein 30A [Aphelenchoides avenae]|nr:transmembrane protein 30A [Aphelenchus avenae]